MKKLAHALPLLTLCLTLALGLAACGGTEPEADTTPKEEDVVLQEDDVEEPTDDDFADEFEDEDTLLAEEEAGEALDATPQAVETKRVGAEGVGFVQIPANWVEFKDVDGNTSLQWCDGTPYTVISLNTFDLSSVPEDQRASFGVEDAANSVWANILNDGAEEDAVQGARVTLAGREALQVYALFPDGSYLVTWVLADDAGVIRYVAAEGPESTIFDTVEMVQNTYEL